MTGFIRRKWQSLENEALTGKKTLFGVLFSRLSAHAAAYLLLICNIFILLLNLPFLLLAGMILLRSRKQKKKKVLFIGLEHIIKKTTDRAALFSKKGYEVNYYSLEATNFSNRENHDEKTWKYSKFTVINLYHFAYDLYSKRICYVEVYLESNFLELLVCLLFCRLSNTLAIVIERGMMINLELKNVGPVFKFFIEAIYRLSDRVFYREPYMMTHFKNMRIPEKHLFFDYNRIPVSEKHPSFEPGNFTVLFLNSFVPSRRLDVVVDAIPAVLAAVPEAKFLLVGARSEEEKSYAAHLLKKNNITYSAQIHAYTSNPGLYYGQASIFVFPSDFVFANFSLLESMERGLTPLVSRVRDAERIVEHGINGFILSQDPQVFADHIILLLKDPELKRKMGMAARATIQERFHDALRIDPILDLLNRASPPV